MEFFISRLILFHILAFIYESPYFKIHYSNKQELVPCKKFVQLSF
jgi:hypothetical protein